MYVNDHGGIWQTNVLKVGVNVATNHGEIWQTNVLRVGINVTIWYSNLLQAKSFEILHIPA